MSDLPDMKIIELGKMDGALTMRAITRIERHRAAAWNPEPKKRKNRFGKMSSMRNIGKLIMMFHLVMAFKNISSLSNSFLSHNSAT